MASRPGQEEGREGGGVLHGVKRGCCYWGGAYEYMREVVVEHRANRGSVTCITVYCIHTLRCNDASDDGYMGLSNFVSCIKSGSQGASNVVQQAAVRKHFNLQSRDARPALKQAALSCPAKKMVSPSSGKQTFPCPPQGN